MSAKIQKLAESLCDEYEAAVVISEVNRFYFTGFPSSDGLLLITKSTNYLLVDFRYGEKAESTANGYEVIVCKSIAESLKDLIIKHNIKQLLFESSRMTVSMLHYFTEKTNELSVQFKNDERLDKLINNLRIIKSADEIEKIEKSQQITDAAFNHILNFIHPGVIERDIALEIEFFMRKNGAERVAFDLITITGKNTSLPHGVPGEATVCNGDFVTMDIGAVFEGYHSDMTRTVAVGNVSDEQKEIYEIVLNAQQNALNNIKSGVSCNDADSFARKIIDKAGYGDYFGHSVGHGVGLEIHEEPKVAPKQSTILSKNMIITVEPGIYLPGKFGVRIEDMVCVDTNGIKNLSNSPKNLIIL
ncbi:MAG: aminopeptidase P family protein [Bacillota bacterium]|nr:aminopeptidase P family protein [Bacillota bacterium]